LHTGDIITISEEQIVQPALLRIGYTVTIRVPSSNRHDTNSYLSRSGLAAIINANGNYEEKQAIIKQVYDNSIYTVVFNDGDEKSLRRSSLCLQGIRLYQTQIGQQKLLEDIPTSTLSTNNDVITSIVAVRRSGNNNQHAFPALILKRKSLADYMWIKSFLDGREYIVHKRDDVESYKTNSDIQSLCRLTSKQATKACEKFIKYNQIPVIWQKKKKKSFNNEQDDESHTNDNHSDTSETDVDDSDEETTEEKDSFVAQLFAFMDDRGKLKDMNSPSDDQDMGRAGWVAPGLVSSGSEKFWI
jgi:Ras-related protein Rab-1A